MIKTYNLALIPVSKSDEIITLAKQFENMADKYLLGEKSLPHVTLYQFQSKENEIPFIWKKVCECLEEKSIVLTFSNFSYITFDNNIFWISLLPDNSDTLHKMHALIAGILQAPFKKTFDPHMTLLSTKKNNYEVEGMSKPIVDTFIISLGIPDNIGQLIEVVNRYAADC